MKRTGPSRRKSTAKVMSSTPTFTIDDLVDDVFKLVLHYVPTYSRMGFNTVHTVSKKWNGLLNESTGLEHRNMDTLIASCQDDVDAWLLLNDEAFLENAEFKALLQVACKDERILEVIINDLTREELNIIGKRDFKVARRLLTDYSLSSKLLNPYWLMGHYAELAIPHLQYSLETLNTEQLCTLARSNGGVASALLTKWTAIKPETKWILTGDLVTAHIDNVSVSCQIFEICKDNLRKPHLLNLGAKHSSLAHRIIGEKVNLNISDNELIDFFSNHLDVAKRFMYEFRDKLSNIQFIDLCIKHPALYREHKNEVEALMKKGTLHQIATNILSVNDQIKTRFENAKDYKDFINTLARTPGLKFKFTSNPLHNDPAQRKKWMVLYIDLLKQPKTSTWFNSKTLCTLCLDDFKAGIFILTDPVLSKKLNEHDLKIIANHRIAYADLINSNPELRKKLNHFLSNGSLQLSMLSMTQKAINEPKLAVFLAKRYISFARSSLQDEVLKHTLSAIDSNELRRRVTIYDRIIQKRNEINAEKKKKETDELHKSKKSRLK